VVIGANNDSIFKRLMHAIGRPDLADDPQLARNEGRVARTEDIDGVIGQWTGARDLDDVLCVLNGADVPAGKIYDIGDIVADAQYRARGMIEQFVLPDGQGVKLPGIVPRLTETPGATHWLGPALGAHTREVLANAGLGDAELAALEREGVILCGG
jgi:crotonobetainyl-CoA:carnitine CoA-transferase CaiB-like acyl-CoA transferase